MKPCFFPVYIIEGIKSILVNNSFCFNDTHFLQIKGTSMGTKFAPIYGTLGLAYLEEKLYTKLEQEFDLDFKHYIQENFKRFLDYCFIFFTRINKTSRKKLIQS